MAGCLVHQQAGLGTLRALLAALAVLAGAVAAAEPAPLVVPYGSTVHLSGSHVYSHGLVEGEVRLQGNTTLEFLGPAPAGGPVLEVGYRALIVSVLQPGAAGLPGANGEDGEDGEHGQSGVGTGTGNGESGTPGEAGTSGLPGADGNAGKAGASLFITVHGSAEIQGKIDLSGAAGGAGGNGGSGGRGGDGGNGGSGMCLSDGLGGCLNDYGLPGDGGAGGQGGAAANGGRGGRGGDAGTLRLLVHGDLQLNDGEIVTTGGAGGAGGHGGAGGFGGNGGFPGSGLCTTGGAAGDNGGNVPSGNGAAGGDGGRGGHVEIRATGKIVTGIDDAPYWDAYFVKSFGGAGGTGGTGGNGPAGKMAIGGGLGAESCDPEAELAYGACSSMTSPRPAGTSAMGGRGGDAGNILLEADAQVYVLDERFYVVQLYATAGAGGAGGFGRSPGTWTGAPASAAYPAITACWVSPLTPLDGQPVASGGDGGDGGSIEVRCGGLLAVQAFARGGRGGNGGKGQPGGWAHTGFEFAEQWWGVPGQGGPGADGGNGGSITIHSPSIAFPVENPAWVRSLAGAGGAGGQGGDANDDHPQGPWGPNGAAGLARPITAITTPPPLFPLTASLDTAPPGIEEVCVGETIRFRFSFTNSGSLAIEEVVLQTAPLPFTLEPVVPETGNPAGLDTSTSVFRLEAGTLAPGAATAMEFEATVLGPYQVGAFARLDATVSGQLGGLHRDDTRWLELPLCPAPGLVVTVTPAKWCALPGGELPFTVAYENLLDIELPGARVGTEALPEGVEYLPGTASPSPLGGDAYNGGSRSFTWELGAVPAGATGTLVFSTLLDSPWPGEDERFSLGGWSESALTPREDQPQAREVALNELATWIDAPPPGTSVRGNHIPVTGGVSLCLDSPLTPGQVFVSFRSSYASPLLGTLAAVTSAPTPNLDGAFLYDEPDLVRARGIETTITPQVSDYLGNSGEATNDTVVHSMFFQLGRDLKQGVLPGMGRLGIPAAGGQRAAIEDWESEYADGPSEDIALQQTDALERLVEADGIARVAVVAARHHYGKLAEGLGSVASLYDLLPILGEALKTRLRTSTKVLRGQWGDEVSIMASEATEIADDLITQASQMGEKKLGMKVASEFQEAAFEQAYGGATNIVEQVGITNAWRLGSGQHGDRMVDWLLSANDNQYPEELLGQSARQAGWIEGYAKRAVEGVINDSLDETEGTLFALGHTGSQDLALVAGGITRTRLGYNSASGLRFSDVADDLVLAGNFVSEAALVIDFVPHPLAETAASFMSSASDLIKRGGGAYKATVNFLALWRIANLADNGQACVREGTLVWLNADNATFLKASAADRARFVATSRRDSSALLAAYDALEAALAPPDALAIAAAHAQLVPPLRQALADDGLRGRRVELLLGAPELGGFSSEQLTTLAEDALDAHIEMLLDRVALQHALLSAATDPTDTVAVARALDALDAARTSQATHDALAAQADALLAQVLLPQAPIVLSVRRPASVPVGATAPLQATIGNFGTLATAGSATLVLETPLARIAGTETHVFQGLAAGAPITLEWHVEGLAPGLVARRAHLVVANAAGLVTDIVPLFLSVEEEEAELLPIVPGASATTGGGTATISVPGGFPRGGARSVERLVLVPSALAKPPAAGFVPVGGAFLLQATDLDATTTLPLDGLALDVTLRYAEEHLPAGLPEASLEAFHSTDGAAWVALATTLDSAANEASASVPEAGWLVLGVADTTPPPPPTGLAFEHTGDGPALLWLPPDPAPTDPAGYRVYTGPDAGSLAPIASVAATNAPRFTVLDAAGAPFWFSVASVDRAGNASALPAPVLVTPQAPDWTARLVPVADVVAPGGTAQWDLDLALPAGSPVIEFTFAPGSAPAGVQLSIDPTTWRTDAGGALRVEAAAAETAAPGPSAISLLVSDGAGEQLVTAPLAVVDWRDVNLLSPAQGATILDWSDQESLARAAAHAVDDDPATGWKTSPAWPSDHWLTIQLPSGGLYALAELRLDLGELPGDTPDLRPARVVLHASDEPLPPTTWPDPLAVIDIPPGQDEVAVPLSGENARVVQLLLTGPVPTTLRGARLAGERLDPPGPAPVPSAMMAY